MATTVSPILSWSDCNSTANCTPYFHNTTEWTYKHDPDEILEAKARYIPAIAVAVPANLSILVLILCHRSLRTRAFFMGVLSMTILDLFYYLFALPINLDHWITWGKWRHGNIVCIIYLFFLNNKLCMSAFMIIALCVERLMAKLRSVAVIGDRKATIVSRVFLVLPWVIGIVVGVLQIVIKMDEMSRHKEIHEKHCVLMVEDTFHIPSLIILVYIPLCLLVLVAITMMAVYRYKRSDWNRLSAETLEPEAVNLQISTVCVWIVSIACVALNVPFVYYATLYNFCRRHQFTCPSAQAIKNTHTVFLFTGVVRPFLWIINVEIRALLLSFKSRLINRFRKSDDQETSIPLSSVPHKMTSDDTDPGI